MPTASIDFRPSMTGSVATPMVIPLTSRMTIWSAPDCIPASRSTSASSDALPAGVADVAAAHRFGDAGQGDVVLGHGPLDQLVEGEGHRLVHHAVDAQLPGVRRDLRHDQGRVHPVEIRLRRIERGQARDVQRLIARQRRHLGDLELRDLGGPGGRGGGHRRGGSPAETLAEQEFAAHTCCRRGNGGGAGCARNLRRSKFVVIVSSSGRRRALAVALRPAGTGPRPASATAAPRRRPCRR